MTASWPGHKSVIVPDVSKSTGDSEAHVEPRGEAVERRADVLTHANSLAAYLLKLNPDNASRYQRVVFLY